VSRSAASSEARAGMDLDQRASDKFKIRLKFIQEERWWPFKKKRKDF